MLRPEVAKKRLTEFKSPRAKLLQRERALALPPHLRSTCSGLLGIRDGKPISDWKQRQAAQLQAAKLLPSHSLADRALIWEALLPAVSKSVQAGWHLFQRLPYQTGYTRRPFRAPNRPELLEAARFEWIRHLCENLTEYDQPATWVAEWGAYLPGWDSRHFGYLLAGTLELGGAEADTVFNTLRSTISGEHPIGAMGRHATSGLLCSSRPDAWQVVERLLLAAQRQEGLRQVILESVDEGHPDAFVRLLRTIVDQDLFRFSSAIRALDVWLGIGLEAADGRKEALRIGDRLCALLGDEKERTLALRDPDPRQVYLSLWATAFLDADAAVSQAASGDSPLRAEDPRVRHAAARLLAQLQHPTAARLLIPVLADPELGVAITALEGAAGNGDEDDDAEVGAFRPSPEDLPVLQESVERLIGRCPKALELPSALWPGTEIHVQRADVVDRFRDLLGIGQVERILPYLKEMDPWPRSSVARELAKMRKLSPQGRSALFSLLADPSSHVREVALDGIRKLRLSGEEIRQAEALLSRKTAGIRQAALSLLLKQPDPGAVASASRLLESKSEQGRLAGLELLRELLTLGRAEALCRQAVDAFRGNRTPSEVEARALEAIPGVATGPQATLQDALGLMNPAGRTGPTSPRSLPGFRADTPAAIALVRDLDRLVHAHREEEVTLVRFQDEEVDEPEDADGRSPELRIIRTTLLGNLEWGLPDPDHSTPIERDLARLPLAEIWLEWLCSRSETMRDPDGFELQRAGVLLQLEEIPRLKRDHLCAVIIRWLRRLMWGDIGAGAPEAQPDPSPSARLLARIRSERPACAPLEFLLDGWESALSRISAADFAAERKSRWGHGRKSIECAEAWLLLVEEHREISPAEWLPSHYKRYWGLLRFVDEPFAGTPRCRPGIERVLTCFQHHAASRDDLLDELLGPDHGPEARSDFDSLETVSRRRRGAAITAIPELEEIVDACRQRVIEVELARGDLPTVATRPALALSDSGGLDTLIRAAQALRDRPMTRGWTPDDEVAATAFTHLIRNTLPRSDETPAVAAPRLATSGLRPLRLVELACFVPQWAAHIEEALGWSGLEDAVWWLHAHTKDEQWTVEQEIKEIWTARVQERTPLTASELLEGAVDVEWFHRMYAAIGEERWRVLNEAARYASGGQGHRRAQLYAEAMLGRTPPEALTERMMQKRHQDSVRAMGLVPLPAGAEARDQAILARYQALQEFLRSGRQFGPMRQQSEKSAVRTALENLARSAGYADPGRLEWAMEARLGEALTVGTRVAEVGPVRVELGTDILGTPEIFVYRDGRLLKAVPAAAKKDPGVAELLTLRRDLVRQASRMRISLEAAMCRGDQFEAGEIAALQTHPVLAPYLRNLVFMLVDAAGDPAGPAGYLSESVDALLGPGDERHRLPPSACLRIAHPYDLHAGGRWHEWQHDCFYRERIQPFKQVFRELYLLTEGEQTDGGFRSMRYSGHQVQPRQARALLGRRGWVSDPEEGEARRSFHSEGLIAWLIADDGWSTPAEVEGLTIDCVGFVRQSTGYPVGLADVPPRVFSEVMRDVDLVVSVAHQGGVDPEASLSTVAMRVSLLRETLGLLKLDNVRLDGSHALIEGKLAHYNVHLGSAVVHRQPGGHLCIVPVHSQHQGRIFLPFVDNDPRTAEVVSKVLLLARDSEIRDPSILEQILPQGGA